MTRRCALVGIVLGTFSASAAAQNPRPLPSVEVRATTAPRTWPDAARRAMRDSLAVARERWARTRPARYDFSMLGAPTMIRPEHDARYEGHLFAVRVHGDSIVQTMLERAPQYTRHTDWGRLTVDGIFRRLEQQLADSSRQVDRLEFDSIFGYPSRWHTTDARNGFDSYVTDTGEGGEVVLFRVAQPVVTCRWWRRVVGRCS